MAELEHVTPVDLVEVPVPAEPPPAYALALEPEPGSEPAGDSVLGFSIEDYGSPRISGYLIPGTGVRMTMRREIAPLLVAVVRDFHREVEGLRDGWCWGFARKRIAGTDRWSNHAWGGAVDLNAPDHPVGRPDTFSPDDQRAIHEILERYTHDRKRVIRWGGDYTGRPDDMHFEINVPRPDALAAVRALPAPPPAVPRPGSRVLVLATPRMSGGDVAFVQRWIGPERCGPADGEYGPETVGGVRYYQWIVGLPTDGIVGPATWARMLGRPADSAVVAPLGREG